MVHDSTADPHQKIRQATEIHEAGCRIIARGPQQNMIGLVLAQDVKDEIRRNRDRARFLLHARKAALDQPGNDGTGPEGSLHERGFIQPILEIIAQHIRVPELAQKAGLTRHAQGRIAEQPDGDGIIIRDKAQRLKTCTLKTPCQQHAERLMGQPALERIGRQIISPAPRKSFDEQVIRPGQGRFPLLEPEPFRDLAGQMVPLLGISSICRTRRARCVESGNFPPA